MASDFKNITWIECGYNWTGPVAGLDAPMYTTDPIAGYIATVIASLVFGSNFVPFKFVETGDGLFCQWVMCIAIWTVGVVVQCIQQSHFYPATLGGGAIWTFANLTVIPIINLIGLSLGMLIWNVTNVSLGWASSRFGLLGECPEDPSDEVLNYLGVGFCIIAGFFFVMIKSEPKFTLPKCLRPAENVADDATDDGSLDGTPDTRLNQSSKKSGSVENLVHGEQEIFLGSWSPLARRILGVILSLLAGCCYGCLEFMEVLNIQYHVVRDGVRASQNGLDYIFSQFCGILLTSTLAFAGYLVYCQLRHKKPFMSIDIIWPSLISGWMWGIATCGFFVANATLSPAITFPIMCTVPGLVGALWGVFLFQEIRGLKNFIYLGIASALTIAGAVMVAFSK